MGLADKECVTSAIVSCSFLLSSRHNFPDTQRSVLIISALIDGELIDESPRKES